MCTLLRDNFVKARKDYNCSAMNLINNYSIQEMVIAFRSIENSGDWWKDLAKLYRRRDRGEPEIRKGEMYRSYAVADNGTVQNIRESIIASRVCQEFDLYPDC